MKKVIFMYSVAIAFIAVLLFLIFCTNEKIVFEEKIPNLITLPSHVKYYDLKEGSGDVVKVLSTINADYSLWLSNGQKVADSKENKRPLRITLHEDLVIKGLILGLEGMKKGGVRRIFIPSELAYGNIRFFKIPPNANLIFEITLNDLN